MSDIYDKSKRSVIMSRISGKDTKPEIQVRKYLFANGFRYRKNVKELPGKPDIVLPKYNTVIFIHGCFWHGHKCKAGKLPETKKDFWTNKISNTKLRDKRNFDSLVKIGWKVIVIWQCELNNKSLFKMRCSELIKEIKLNINS
jgi:DNA mismatch endonuclease (patch repair protein)